MRPDQPPVPESEQDRPSVDDGWVGELLDEFDALMDEIGADLVEGGETSITMPSQIDGDQEVESRG